MVNCTNPVNETKPPMIYHLSDIVFRVPPAASVSTFSRYDKIIHLIIGHDSEKPNCCKVRKNKTLYLCKKRQKYRPKLSCMTHAFQWCMTSSPIVYYYRFLQVKYDFKYDKKAYREDLYWICSSIQRMFHSVSINYS